LLALIASSLLPEIQGISILSINYASVGFSSSAASSFFFSVGASSFLGASSSFTSSFFSSILASSAFGASSVAPHSSSPTFVFPFASKSPLAASKNLARPAIGD
jgi:hypothetical protein